MTVRDMNHQITVCDNPDRAMKVLAINASPHKDRGNTSLILNQFLSGMIDARAEVEKFFTSDLSINPCLGDVNCQFRPDGKCIHRDDMDMILSIIQDADILVFATPLQVDGACGPLKVLMDRMLPLLNIYIEDRDGHCRHALKKPKNRSIALVSSCGFWELNNFDPLVAHVKAFASNFSAKYAGELLRPHANLFRTLGEQEPDVKDITEASWEAGQRLILEGYIPKDLSARVSRPLVSKEAYIEASNRRYSERLSRQPVNMESREAENISMK